MIVSGPETIFDIRDGDRVLAYWFVENNMRNLLAILYERLGVLCLDYRFRHYVDDKAFDSDDIKRSFRCELPPMGDGEAIEKIRTTFRELAITMNIIEADTGFSERIVNGGPRKFFRMLIKETWANVKRVERGHN